MADPDLHDVFVVHPDGTNLTPVTSSSDGLGSFEAVWSPDGTRLLFGRSPDGDQFHFDLWIVNLDGTGLVRLTHTPAEYSAYEWASADVGA
jgi:Tol biopolymer transport system component